MRSSDEQVGLCGESFSDPSRFCDKDCKFYSSTIHKSEFDRFWVWYVSCQDFTGNRAGASVIVMRFASADAVSADAADDCSALAVISSAAQATAFEQPQLFKLAASR